MPHSSGGGSHGGGSHGGGSHGGSHGSGSRGVSRSYYPGARRYRYTHRGRTEYIYSKSDPSKAFTPARLLIGLLYIPFIIGGFAAIGSQMKTVKPCADTSILIDDAADVIYDRADLEHSLEKFMDKSGVTPAVVTLNNESWMKSYSSLEDYAHSRYLKEFDDEKHWLIVYSTPVDRNSNDWYWEGMQGDYTDGVLNETVTTRFRYDLQERLENSDGDTGGDIARAFDTITPTIKRGGIGSYLKALGPGLGILAFVAFHAYFMLGFYDLKYKNAVLDEDDSTPELAASSGGFDDLPVFSSSPKADPMPSAGESICDFCGGTYPIGAKRCPHCMAKLDDRTL